LTPAGPEGGVGSADNKSDRRERGEYKKKNKRASGPLPRKAKRDFENRK